jgi:hypothetical protein
MTLKENVIAAAIAGIASSIVTHPVDVIKTNHMVNHKIAAMRYWPMVKYLYRESGLIGFSRGMVIRTFHMAIMSTILLCGYESFINFFMLRIRPL